MNRPAINRILVPDNRLGDALRLRRGSSHPLKRVQRNDPAVDVERHEHALCVFGERPDVVQQAGQEPGFIAELPVREVLARDCEACAMRSGVSAME